MDWHIPRLDARRGSWRSDRLCASGHITARCGAAFLPVGQALTRLAADFTGWVQDHAVVLLNFKRMIRSGRNPWLGLAVTSSEPTKLSYHEKCEMDGVDSGLSGLGDGH